MVYFAVKRMKCSSIYEHGRGLDLIEKHFTLKAFSDADVSLFSLLLVLFLFHNKATPIEVFT